jgi:Domain of unknown function (DUF3303)
MHVAPSARSARRRRTGSDAFILAETDDPKGIYRWVTGWADLIEFDVVPVIDDEEAAAILQELKL